MGNRGGGVTQASKAVLWMRPAPPCVFEALGANTAAFDPITGETHLLNELPAMLLSTLNNDAASTADLIARIAGPIQLEPHDEDQIVTALAFLESAGLAESHSSDLR